MFFQCTDINSSKTLIDVIQTNKYNNISSTAIFPSSLSDHDLIGGVRKLHNIKYQPKATKCYNYANYNSDNINKELQHYNWNEVYDSNSAETSWNIMHGILITTLDKHAPLIIKKIKRKSSPSSKRKH